VQQLNVVQSFEVQTTDEADGPQVAKEGTGSGARWQTQIQG